MKKFARSSLVSLVVLGTGCMAEPASFVDEMGRDEQALVEMDRAWAEENSFANVGAPNEWVARELKIASNEESETIHCEMAWAGSAALLGHDSDVSQNHVIGPIEPGNHVFEINAGRAEDAQRSLDGINMVGTMYVAYDGSQATIKISTLNGYELNAAQVDVVVEQLADGPSEDFAASDRLLKIREEQAVDSKIYSVSGLHGSIYLNARAVICGY